MHWVKKGILKRMMRREVELGREIESEMEIIWWENFIYQLKAHLLFLNWMNFFLASLFQSNRAQGKASSHGNLIYKIRWMNQQTWCFLFYLKRTKYVVLFIEASRSSKNSRSFFFHQDEPWKSENNCFFSSSSHLFYDLVDRAIHKHSIEKHPKRKRIN